MKCLKCGYVTSESKENCARCGSPLPVHGNARTRGVSRQTTPEARPAEPAASSSAPSSDSVPDWRKEVSRKVKEYGEKKRILTTPPQPLKDGESYRAQPDPEPPVEPEQPAPRIASPAFSRVEPPEPDSPAVMSVPDTPPAPSAPRETETRVPRHLPPLNEEIFAGDLNDEMFLDETEEGLSGSDVPLFLGRRSAALIIDSVILVALHALLLYLCAEIISYNFHDLFQEALVPLAAVFLLFHCLYYAYFYKTSRQTPGQVFFGIELRDPLAGTIALRKILIRWLCLVVLNVLNLIPLVMGHHFLVLDRASGTQIRTLQ